MQQRGKVILSYALTAFYGLGLLVWPPAVGSLIFLFIAPHVVFSPSFLLLLYVAFSVVLYPGYWLLGAYFGWRSAKRDQPVWRVLLMGSVPLLSALWFAGVPLAVSITWDALTEEHPNRTLYAPAIYYLGDERLAVWNPVDFFLDPPPEQKRGASAWIVDLKTDKPDGAGIIYLGPHNLDPKFFLEHDREQLELVVGLRTLDEEPPKPREEGSKYSASVDVKRRSGVTLRTPKGDIFLRVVQD